MKNKIITTVLLMMMISSIGIANAATITTEIKDHLVTISVSSVDNEKWGAYISSDIDHNNGQSGDSEQYLYFVERVVGTGNVEFKRMYPSGNYLVSLYVSGDLVDFSEFAFVPDPILTPTPTPTPTPEPTPTPTPVPTPTATPDNGRKSGGSSGGDSTGSIDFSSFGSYSSDATLSFNSSPAGAMVYINKQKLSETPVIRDVVAGRYRIEMRLAGYKIFQQDINPEAGEVEEINVVLEPLVIVPEPQIVTMSAIPVTVINDTHNDTVATTTPTQNDTNTTLFYVVSLVVIIVAILGFAYMNLKHGHDTCRDMSDSDGDIDTLTKMKGLLKSNPEYRNEEMAEKIGVTVRTIERNRKKINEENK